MRRLVIILFAAILLAPLAGWVINQNTENASTFGAYMEQFLPSENTIRGLVEDALAASGLQLGTTIVVYLAYVATVTLITPLFWLFTALVTICGEVFAREK